MGSRGVTQEPRSRRQKLRRPHGVISRRVASPLHERDLSADLDAVASSADEKDGSSVDEHNIEVSEDDASVGENAMQDSPVRGMQDPDYSPAPDSVRVALKPIGMDGQ
ncbi:MAG: hypothetical protein FRX49_11134 [Trebouxia sp. A1-2]|nr:MAG: hypothetical protein FRX49_11134 [Trebouxia sp. A1-2]